ncbi:ankyrin repeat protein-like protein [Aaosphaeria arxii CBS 175.79]|uniref:Ankyrin repeat protein-like protein n=1 Tax=Aaosphaeria arxii CBS 175.79 TaxID=1450172 RepID=A0A6A5Y4Z0_9PLEO|nr:ankyrin repeat protein-like protein [Aaosphaeria arxii CBS 175.79]KAF2020622.1 ankyrin repeat protein-like protein [Aaosphaeria arxii CBS 175.79]
MADDEGASPRELIFEACRRDNTALLEETIESLAAAAKKAGKKEAEFVAETLNTAQDGVGNGVLHVAAMYGSYDVLDVLLDQEGLEIDEIDRLEKDTPLHKGIRYVNSLEQSDWPTAGQPIIEILLDAGCDPRIRNAAKLKPVELVDPRNTELKKILQKAEFAMMAGADVVQEDDDDPNDVASDSD